MVAIRIRLIFLLNKIMYNLVIEIFNGLVIELTFWRLDRFFYYNIFYDIYMKRQRPRTSGQPTQKICLTVFLL